MIGDFLKAAISPITNIFTMREKRKALVAKLKNNEVLSKEESTQAQAEMRKGSWKDEFVLVTLAFPLWICYIGILVFAFTGTRQLLDAGFEMIALLNEIDQDSWYGTMLTAAFLVALGIYGILKFRNR